MTENEVASSYRRENIFRALDLRAWKNAEEVEVWASSLK